MGGTVEEAEGAFVARGAGDEEVPSVLEVKEMDLGEPLYLMSVLPNLTGS